MTDTSRKRFYYIIILLVLVSGSLRMYGFITKNSFRNDAYYYVYLAQNLGSLNYTINGDTHTQYPPLYPIAIFTVRTVSLNSIDWLTAGKIVPFISGFAVVLLIFFICRKIGLSLFWSALAAFLQAVAPLSIAMGGGIFAEALFTALLLGAAYSALFCYPLLTGLLLGLCCLTRYEGFLLIPCLWFLWPRKFSVWGKFGAVFFIIYIPWLFFIFSHFGKFVAFSYPIDFLVNPDPHAGFSFISSAFSNLTYGLAVIGGTGLLLMARGKRALLGGFVLLFFVLHCFWYYNIFYFVIPLLPFFSVGAAVALQKLSGAEFLSSGRRLATALAVCFAVLLIPMAVKTQTAFEYLVRAKVDPLSEIINRLPPYEKQVPLIGFIEPLISKYHGGPAIIRPSAEELNRSPHEFVVESYLEKDARNILWNPIDGSWIYYFGFLAKGDSLSTEVDFQCRRYRLTYEPLMFFRYWEKEFILYGLELDFVRASANKCDPAEESHKGLGP